MSIKLFLICVWSVGVFSVRAAVPVEGIIYFKEGKSVGFSGDHRVCIPKKGKDVKAFRGIFTRDKQKEVYPAEEIDSIVCWHPRTPEFRRKFDTGRGYRLVLAVFCYAAYRGLRLLRTGLWYRF